MAMLHVLLFVGPGRSYSSRVNSDTDTIKEWPPTAILESRGIRPVGHAEPADSFNVFFCVFVYTCVRAHLRRCVHMQGEQQGKGHQHDQVSEGAESVATSEDYQTSSQTQGRSVGNVRPQISVTFAFAGSV